MKKILLSGVKCKRTQELLRFLQGRGYDLSFTGKCHIRIESEGKTVTVSSLTSSDHRSFLKFRADLRRAIPEVMQQFTK